MKTLLPIDLGIAGDGVVYRNLSVLGIHSYGNLFTVFCYCFFNKSFVRYCGSSQNNTVNTDIKITLQGMDPEFDAAIFRVDYSMANGEEHYEHITYQLNTEHLQ